MIKRVFATFILLGCLYTTAMANREISVKLDDKERVYSENLGYAYITFEYIQKNGNNARVMVSVENITPSYAVLVFRKNLDENALKQAKPKIEFEKKYPGKKGERSVIGCNVDYKSLDIVTAAETDTLFTLDVPFTSARDITVAMYLAKYKPKDLFKKGKYKISYKILEQYIYDIHLQVVGWSEDDPAYVKVKKEVAEYLTSLENVRFCTNKKHKPSLKEQQRPYVEKKDSLVNVIRTIIETNPEWMSQDEPHRAYTRLLTELDNVNLDAKGYDCGSHKNPDPKPTVHSCSYCSLSAQEIFQRLDDLYQQLYAGKISKDRALKAARAYYTCYQKSGKRKQDSNYTSKISRFYNRIANY